jgi:hypothetical protein
MASVGSDVIFSERRGQSQKPEEIYELVEQLVPRGGWHLLCWCGGCCREVCAASVVAGAGQELGAGAAALALRRRQPAALQRAPV